MFDSKSSGFSLETKSKKHLKNISISYGLREAVLIEGDLGPLKDVSFFEDRVLIVKGSYGTLRVELSEALIRDLVLASEKKGKK